MNEKIKVKLSGYGSVTRKGNPLNLTPNTDDKIYTYKNCKTKMLSVARSLEHFQKLNGYYCTLVTFTKKSTTVESQTKYAQTKIKVLTSALRKRGIKYYYMWVTETTPSNHIHTHLALLHSKKWLSWGKSGFIKWARKHSVPSKNNVDIQHIKKRKDSRGIFYLLKYIRKMYYISDETANKLLSEYDGSKMNKHAYNVLKAWCTRNLSSTKRLWSYSIPYYAEKEFLKSDIEQDIDSELITVKLGDSSTTVEVLIINKHFSKLSKNE